MVLYPGLQRHRRSEGWVQPCGGGEDVYFHIMFALEFLERDNGKGGVASLPVPAVVGTHTIGIESSPKSFEQRFYSCI